MPEIYYDFGWGDLQKRTGAVMEKMSHLQDLLKICVARRKNGRRFFCLTVVNVVISFMLLFFFLQLTCNVMEFSKEQFLSDQYLHYVTVKTTEEKLSEKFSDITADKRVEACRVIYDSDVEVKKIDAELDFSCNLQKEGTEIGDTAIKNVSDLDITIMDAEDFLFSGDYAVDTLFEQGAENSKKGIVISGEFLELFGNESPIGKNVTFDYEGKEISLPITAVMNYDAALNYSNSGYMSVFYVLTDALQTTDFQNVAPECVDVYIHNVSDVPKFIDQYKDRVAAEGAYLQANSAYIKQRNTMLKIEGAIIVIVGGIFLFLTSFSILNGMDALQQKNRKNYALLQILGFSRKNICTLIALDSIQIWGCSMVAGLLLILAGNTVLHVLVFPYYNMLVNLFYINKMIVLLSAIFTFGVVILCNFISWYKNKNPELLEILKSE